MIQNIELILIEMIIKADQSRTICLPRVCFKNILLQVFHGIQIGSANPSPTLIVHLVPFKSHAICTPSGVTRHLSSWLGFPALVHSFNSDAAHWSYIGVTQGASGKLIKAIALQLKKVPMLNLTAVVFTSVLYLQENHFTILRECLSYTNKVFQYL